MTTEYIFKIIIIGSAAVGKSSLIRRFVEDEFSFDYQFTIGADFLTKTVEYEKGKLAKLSIWDVGGQERFKFLRRSFYQGTHGAMLLFDLSRAKTLPRMKEWLTDMNNIIQKEIPMVIIGNKSDLLPDVGEVIDPKEVQAFAEQYNSYYLTTSARNGDNVEKAFTELTNRMLKFYA